MPTKPVKKQQGQHVGETRDPVLVDLALQGGGSHGAFTWGVLDRLMDERWLRIDGISGTSAGALNAFWRRVADSARLSPIPRSPLPSSSFWVRCLDPSS